MWENHYDRDEIAIGRIEKSIHSSDEMTIAFNTIGKELLHHEDTYPGKSVRAYLNHLLRNNRNFFFRDLGNESIAGIS